MARDRFSNQRRSNSKDEQKRDKVIEDICNSKKI